MKGFGITIYLSSVNWSLKETCWKSANTCRDTKPLRTGFLVYTAKVHRGQWLEAEAGVWLRIFSPVFWHLQGMYWIDTFPQFSVRPNWCLPAYTGKKICIRVCLFTSLKYPPCYELQYGLLERIILFQWPGRLRSLGRKLLMSRSVNGYISFWNSCSKAAWA